ncbi:MAG: RnfABCDGE type electron transport complex subunit B [Ruminococcaceae bacterium]|nr:RnfABCDGE type electron transport complex subunit B [Oscillospiraceae bacterium]
MNGIVLAIISVSLIGVVCAAILAVASKIMEVKEDETFIKIRECMPGANCGACGYTGCDGYAHALAEEEGVKTNLCIPGADAVAKQIAAVLGVESEDVIERVATVRCGGDCNTTMDKMIYQGIQTCAAAKLLYGGKGSCTYGCMGLGDCAAVCPNDAICIQNGIAHIDTRRCTGCGLCEKTCPNGVIALMDDVEMILVTCNNKEKGAVVRKKCDNGCIGCKRCEKVCSTGAIKVINNLAVIDYDKCPECDDPGACARICTVGCISISNFRGIHKL